ncbi:MAG: glycosyltransferase [Chryseobacterium sp.]|nr:MAG: glycosyltransferase [Chryseobacterium sp.]
MKLLIVIPAHNEEENIQLCLESLANQTFRSFRCIVVNDGSTDSTGKIVEQFRANDRRFQLLNLGVSEHQPGAKVVRTFNKGLETVDVDQFDVICKFDADIIFPGDYLERIVEAYNNNPKAGMVSGLVSIEKGGEWVFENLSSKNHVRGPIKSYRKQCFLDMDGLLPVLGWDNIDVMLAQMHGWEVVTIKGLWVKHLRPTAYKYKAQKAEKLGEYFYNIGLSLPLAVISSAKSAIKNRSFSEFLTTIKSFLRQNKKRELSADEIRYIRKLRWREMFKKISL